MTSEDPACIDWTLLLNCPKCCAVVQIYQSEGITFHITDTDPPTTTHIQAVDLCKEHEKIWQSLLEDTDDIQ